MVKELITEVTKEELQKIAVAGAHLHQWQGEGESDIMKVFHKQATVQLDPLNPAGRNHDIFFAARMSKYKINSFQKIAYIQKEVFESYFPNLMAISKKYFPIFLPQMKKRYLHKYYQARIDKMEESMSGFLEEATSFLDANGPSKAADLKEMAKIKPDLTFWKTSNLAGMSLELLWLLGRVVIHERDEHWRKTYGLVDGYFDDSMLKESTLTDEEINYKKFLLKQKSYPLINLGKVTISEKKGLVFSKKKRLSPDWFERTDDLNKPEILKVENENLYFGVPAHWEEFRQQKIDTEMRAIAPLDPLIWDRELTLKVFDFEYVWEVYKIPKDRRWGYYVFPLLYESKFFGRLEANYDKKKKILHLFNLQLEEDKGFDNKTEGAFARLAERWSSMLDASKITSDKSLGFL
ncbi:MAG: DNA glycosylase AlkZ-like family protein [Candidatus Heimdallarchaeaceae archaeon]